MENVLPPPVQTALDSLSACGYEAYAVGGCVRDMLLGHVPHDWDVCTNAQPGQVALCFSGRRVIETGIVHGTVTVVVDGQPIEITTYRVDGAYADHRRPDAVRFTASIQEDLARRDFTINAMAFRPDTGILDFFGGRDDLRAGVVRCVGNADHRFAEDALRMLRALRFASRLGFAIAPGTRDALLRHREELRYVAQERILHELCGMNFASIDEAYLPVLQVVIPELKGIRACPGLPEDPAIRLGLLLAGLDARTILRRLKAPGKLMERAALLAAEADIPVGKDRIQIKKKMRDMGPEALMQLLQMQENDRGLTVAEDVIQSGEPYSLRQLNIDGGDIVALGVSGKQVGRILGRLLDAAMEGKVSNNHLPLIEAAAEMAKETGEDAPGPSATGS